MPVPACPPLSQQRLVVAIYEPKEPRLGDHHPPLRYRYNEVMLPVATKHGEQAAR